MIVHSSMIVTTKPRRSHLHVRRMAGHEKELHEARAVLAAAKEAVASEASRKSRRACWRRQCCGSPQARAAEELVRVRRDELHTLEQRELR